MSGIKAGWIPFSNGTEFCEWLDGNCWECIKGWDERFPDRPRCALEDTLFDAVGMPAWAIRRVGYQEVHANTEPTKMADGTARILRFVTLSEDCRERVRRGEDGSPEGPRPDSPGQRFLWSDLFYERADEDRAESQEVAASTPAPEKVDA